VGNSFGVVTKSSKCAATDGTFKRKQYKCRMVFWVFPTFFYLVFFFSLLFFFFSFSPSPPSFPVSYRQVFHPAQIGRIRASWAHAASPPRASSRPRSASAQPAESGPVSRARDRIISRNRSCDPEPDGGHGRGSPDRAEHDPLASLPARTRGPQELIAHVLDLLPEKKDTQPRLRFAELR